MLICRADHIASTIALVDLTTIVMIEIVNHAALTAKDADNVLIEIANQLEANSRQTTNTRAARCFAALAHNLIATEPGA